MCKSFQAAVLIVVSILTTIPVAFSYQDQCKDGENKGCYVFSWPIDDDCASTPRGGTSKGGAITLASEPTSLWAALQASELSKFERDRRAILAMQGGYKVNFDFLETIGFSPDYKRDRPYQSWGTEYVYVVKDEPKFISLQHVMVMVFQQDDGSVSEPMVMKHWRQDWRYEDDSMLEYNHGEHWKNRKLSQHQRQGRWTQAVFQVDDSPRYESIDEWQHNGAFSSWKSELTRRPLPRREHSVRDDYDVLEGTNTHVVTRHGWVQVEENWKMVIDQNGQVDQALPYLAKEQGIARYQPIVEFDFSPGDDYMALAGQFWADVRAEWARRIDAGKAITVKRNVDKKPLFISLFGYAGEIMKQGSYDQKAGKEFAAEQIALYIQAQ